MIEVSDEKIISFLRKISSPLTRFSLFIIFFWFGILKIFDLSPANPLVKNLLEATLPFITFETFIILFGILEMVIGFSFLLKGFEKVAIALLVPHMITTFLPLILLREITWQGFLAPTLEGQYIIKNLVIIALVISIAANLTPLKAKPKLVNG